MTLEDVLRDHAAEVAGQVPIAAQVEITERGIVLTLAPGIGCGQPRAFLIVGDQAGALFQDGECS